MLRQALQSTSNTTTATPLSVDEWAHVPVNILLCGSLDASIEGLLGGWRCNYDLPQVRGRAVMRAAKPGTDPPTMLNDIYYTVLRDVHGCDYEAYLRELHMPVHGLIYLMPEIGDVYTHTETRNDLFNLLMDLRLREIPVLLLLDARPPCKYQGVTTQLEDNGCKEPTKLRWTLDALARTLHLSDLRKTRKRELRLYGGDTRDGISFNGSLAWLFGEAQSVQQQLGSKEPFFVSARAF